MADHTYKLSEIPLKKRLGHFWEYYKVPTIIIAVFAIIALSIVKAIFFTPNPDVCVIVASSRFIPEETCDKLELELKQFVSDYDEDKKELLDFNVSIVDETTEMDIQQYAASNQRLIAVLASADYIIQIADEKMFNFLNDERLVGTYAELSEYETGKNADELIKIPLSEIDAFKNIASELNDEYYLTLRGRDACQLRDKEKKIENFENHVDAFAAIAGFDKK